MLKNFLQKKKYKNNTALFTARAFTGYYGSTVRHFLYG
jgi:hypothetical protein